MKQLKVLGLVESDLLWLVSQGHVQLGQVFGRESKTRPAGKARKQQLSDKTSVVLTKPGANFVRARLVPNYNLEERRFTVGGLLVKHFKEPAAAQETILQAFQELKWAPAMDDPLPRIPGIAPKLRLHDTVKNLNRHQKRRLVRFSVQGNGTKVRWHLVL